MNRRRLAPDRRLARKLLYVHFRLKHRLGATRVLVDWPAGERFAVVVIEDWPGSSNPKEMRGILATSVFAASYLAWTRSRFPKGPGRNARMLRLFGRHLDQAPAIVAMRASREGCEQRKEA